MSNIDLSRRYVRNPDIIAADMDGDTVMMSIERGEYFGLSGVGSRVWELLAEPVALPAIARAICAEYEVDEPTCKADMQAFLADLQQQGLINAATD